VRFLARTELKHAPRFKKENVQYFELFFNCPLSRLFNSIMNETQQNSVRRNLSFEDRQSVITFLLSHSVNGKLKRGQILEAAGAFNCHRNSISAIWKRHNENKTEHNYFGDVYKP
jgi:hypothetical protein